MKEYIQIDPNKVRLASKAETTAHILRGLISYHERMTMGMYPERDFYPRALRYALELVERELEKESSETT